MKLKSLLAVAIAAGTLIGCNPDEDMNAPEPTLSVTEVNTGITNDDIIANPGQSLKFAWSALRVGEGGDLETFTLNQNGSNTTTPLPTTTNGETLPLVDFPSKYEAQYNDTIVLNAGTNLGTTTYTFSVSDDNGNVVSRTIVVTVASVTTPLTIEKTGQFYHAGGSLFGAYDLIADTSVSAAGSSASQDLLNTDMAGSAFTGSWEAGNSTVFIKMNSFDYANATEEAIQAVFAAGTPVATISNPQQDDIYLVNLRGNDVFAAIKITNVDPADNTCSCGNTGKIAFTYKKN